MLTYSDGKILPREWYDGEAMQEAIDLIESRTPEETYTDMLRIGLPRDERIEARIDMSKIDPGLDLPRRWRSIVSLDHANMPRFDPRRWKFFC
jgi:hypothetical protein